MDDLEARAEGACKEAGLGVMWAIFEVLLDREVFAPTEVLTAIAEGQVNIGELYEGMIGPAIDRLERFFVDEVGLTPVSP